MENVQLQYFVNIIILDSNKKWHKNIRIFSVIISLTPCVKVARVILVIKLGDKVCLHPQQVTPVNAGKVVMLLDLKSTPSAQPVHGALLQQQGDDILGLGLHRPVLLLRPLNSIMHRVGKQLLWSLTKEGDAANEELVEDDAHAPPVNWLAVSLSQNHLEKM